MAREASGVARHPDGEGENHRRIPMNPRHRTNVRWWLIRSQRFAPVRIASRAACRLGAWRLGRILDRDPAVASVYVRHGTPASPTFVPGKSDLDLTLVLEKDAADDPDRLSALWWRIECLARRYFFLCPADVRFTTGGELRRWSREGAAPLDLLHPVEIWRLLAGDEVREPSAEPVPFVRPSRHPEFHMWWSNLLQRHALGRREGTEGRYLRPMFRCALKNQVQLGAARGTPPDPASLFGDAIPGDETFRPGSHLPSLLRELAASRFWNRRPEALADEIFLEALRETAHHAACAADRAGGKDSVLREPERRTRVEPDDRCAPFHASLRAAIEGTPGLRRNLVAAVAYREPHTGTSGHRLDLVLPDDIPLDRFREFLEAYRARFASRTFVLEGRECSTTVLLSEIYRDPSIRRGTPSPFLAEHVRKWGRTILGEAPPPRRGDPEAHDLREWCRIFLPYHRFNYLRLPGKPVRFAEIAAIRVFLESGETPTVVEDTEARYLDLLEARAADREWVATVVRGSGRPWEPGLFRSAYPWVLAEYERLEAALR